MSIRYYCDICSREIDPARKRNIITLHRFDTDKKKVYHACDRCYEDSVEAIFKKDKVNNTNSKEETQVLNKTIVIDVENVSYSNFNKPRVKATSKYFTVSTCYYIHRLHLMGAKSIRIAEMLSIPYQSVKNYLNSFILTVDDGYITETRVDDLKQVEERIKHVIPKIKSLYATCTWSVKDIASDVDALPEDVETFFRDFPWFENRLKGNN